MAAQSIRRREDGSFEMPEGWMPVGEDLDILKEHVYTVAQEVRCASDVCRKLALRPLILRQLRITDVDFQVKFDLLVLDEAVPRHRVGKRGTDKSQNIGDPIDTELMLLSNVEVLKRTSLELTADMYPKIQEALERSGSWQKAADYCGITVNTLRKAADRDSSLSELIETAMRRYQDAVRDKLRERAMDGWLVPIVGGKDRDTIVGYEPKFSDRLLELEAKRVDPSYRDHKIVEQSTMVSVVQQMDLSSLSTRARAAYRAFLQIVKEDEEQRRLELATRADALPALRQGDTDVPPAGVPLLSEAPLESIDGAVHPDMVLPPMVRRMRRDED